MKKKISFKAQIILFIGGMVVCCLLCYFKGYYDGVEKTSQMFQTHLEVMQIASQIELGLVK